MVIFLFCMYSMGTKVQASNYNEYVNSVVNESLHNIETNLPRNGVSEFETFYRDNNTRQTRSGGSFIYRYGYKYTKGQLLQGAWRNGVSGGSTIAASVLSMNRSSDTSYNVSFTASVSGSYSSGYNIGADLGVTLGKSRNYSLGSGYTVTVPKGKHYLIQYRPVYYKYTVVETKYMEQYVPGVGLRSWPVGSKTCYVDVFSHWDYRATAN